MNERKKERTKERIAKRKKSNYFKLRIQISHEAEKSKHEIPNKTTVNNNYSQMVGCTDREAKTRLKEDAEH